MKICFIGPADSYHIKKWCKWFSKKGNQIYVISFEDAKIQNAEVIYINPNVSSNSNDVSKIKYLLKAKTIKKIVNQIKPDIINVHYASSYGTVVALSGIRNYVLSLWGSDIYEFPKKSLLHKWLLKFSLNKAKYVFSTSTCMSTEAQKYTNKKIEITPFGVNMDLFNPKKRTRNDGAFVVGTVKALKDTYGIEDIIESVAIFNRKYPNIDIRLRIAGKGPDEQKYKELSKKMKIEKKINWLGFISQEQAAIEWANMDVGIIPSISESYGVSAIEAEASGIPLIISDAPGLTEVTIPGETSLIVKKGSPKEISDILFELYNNKKKRQDMGEKGRKFVENRYEYDNCFYNISELFGKIMIGEI